MKLNLVEPNFNDHIPRLILYFYHTNETISSRDHKKDTMGKSKKSLEDLKKDLKTLRKNDMKKIVGGKNDKNKKKFNNGCGGIVPQ
jgi:hypothetical protein